MKLAITVLIFLCLFKTIASLFSSGGVLHEDDILTVAEFRRHHRSRDRNFLSDKIEQNTNFRIQKGGVDDDDNDDDDDDGNEWQTDVHIGSKLSGFAELSRDENYQDDENMGHQQHHQQQHHHNIDGAAARRPYDRSFYDDNYAVEDAPSTSTSDESFLNDLPQGKKLEPPFVYSRRQVPSKLLYTKEITIKQGRVKGIVRNMYPQSGLRDVDQFLGLPYAEPPVGSNRFMPPGAPPPWQGLKIASHLPSVCPQNIPDLSKSNLKLSKGRMDQLNRLLPYLKHESEDCLYLNVYVPKSDGLEMSQKYPVIVYIHGESYEWNSGNPYDGSVLASYGQVIVVTINYRLGVLGFMKPGISDNTPSNFGLLDQIAALQWVKDNIAAFGGDSSIVTLMGHGTGAACANFLMVSPIANGLFHRAILMSGSAMSDWATANHSLQITMQIAHGLNCPQTDENEEMLNCLRKKRYQEILKIPASTPQFSTSFGPIVDGSVIRNQPYKDMGTYTDLFSRYDLLFGVTEVESYHTLTAQALQEGLRENERDNLLRFYMQNRFEIRPDLALAATLKKYTEIYNNPVQATMHEHRDAVLDIISDARVVAPVVQTGIFHAKVNPRSYMYVFAHNSEAGAYANLQHSITGEELAFVFGAPLAPAGPFHLKYSTQERLLSEAVMLYWTNFAKTGNPKAPWRDSFLTLHALEWERYDIDWPDFNTRNQCYVNIGIPPSLGFRYRNIYMNFWNKELPDELNQIATIQPQPYYHYFPPSPTQLPRRGTSTDPNDIIRGHLARFPPTRKVDPTKDSIRTLKILLQEQLETADNMYNAQPTFGASTENTNAIPETDDHEGKEIIKSESTIHILVGVVVLFLIFNIIIALTYVMKKKKKNSPFNRKLGILSYDGTTDDELKRSKNNDGDDSYILDIVRKSNTYEAVKTNRSGNSPINGFKVTRQLSTSTVDAHTKVCDWISQDLAKCSPKSSKKSSPSFSLKGRSFLRRPRKISVAIDATPQARSSSILRQEPIEVTKLKTTDTTRNNIIICQEVEVDAELLNPECLEPVITTHRRGSTSSMQERRQGLRIDHKHSRSDPVDMYYTMSANDEKVTSFIDSDVNVTSRDEGDEEKDPLSPEEQLQNIKRRNFPKVLPDYPNDDESFSTVAKRKSLSSFNFPSFQGMRVPPAPPPRTVTTPNRRPYSNRRQSNNITTSPLMLAEDYPEEDEPEIAKNTLIVGPLLPKSQESIYCTVNRRKQCNSGENLNSPPSNTDPDTKPTKPSGIKPPSAFSSLPTKPPTISTETLPQSRLEPKIIIKPSTPKAAAAAAIPRSNIPRVHVAHDSTSRIPHLKTPSLSSLDRDKSTPESSSSDTSSSTGTVKTELKQN